MSTPTTLRPSLSAVIWMVFFLALTFSDWRLVLISADGDPALHWRIGNWMIEHREVIRTEQFSHTKFGTPLISKEWLSEIVFAAAGIALGWNGAVLLGAALIATTLWLLHRLLLREGCDLVLATGLVLLAAFSMSHHWLARPHLFTHVLTVAFLWKLREGKQLWLLPVLMLVWTNLHGAFFTGFVLIGCFWLGALFTDRSHLKALTGIGLACLLASFVNPNGWNLHLQVLQFLQSPTLAAYANEFRSPNFHSAGMHGFLLLLLTLFLMLFLARPKLRATDLVLIIVWLFFALRAARNIPIFTLCIIPIIAEQLTNLPWLQRFRPLSTRLGTRSRTGFAAPVAALAIWFAFRPATDVLPDRFPVAAVEFLRNEPTAVAGEMFNDYGWGGYLMLAMPERKVFVDGRNDFYGAELMEEFDEVDEVKAGWADVLVKYGVGWTILPVKHPLNALLALSPEWREAHRDDVAVIYTHR